MAPKKRIMWLLPMKKVLYALFPAALASVYFYGWRAFILIAVTVSAAYISEYLFARHYDEPVNSSVFVTGLLLAMTLPPSLPFWMAAVGAVFGVVFGKMVFGGFGKNPFNPALVGRAFIYITFAQHMTSRWYVPANGLFGGFSKYTPDAVTAATFLKTSTVVDNSWYLHAAIGNISGSLGETSAILLFLGGIYLFWKKIANRSIVISTFLGMVGMQGIFWLLGVRTTVNPLAAFLSGGFVLGMFFMATDPVSAPKQNESKILYGLFIGIMTVLIRVFSVWPEGMMFAILLGNTFAPITDYGISQYKLSRKAKALKGDI